MHRLLSIMDYVPRATRTIDHFILDFARAVRERGWELKIAVAGKPSPQFAQALTERGVECVVIPFPLTQASIRELRRQLGGYRPDLVQASFISAFTGALLRLKRSGFTRRLIVIDHSSGETPLRRGWRRLASRLRGWRVGRTLDAILPVSQTIARRDIERVFLPTEKVRVIYNGIRLCDFPNPVRSTRATPLVAYAGQLIPEKGVMTLLRAHVRLRREGATGYELVIAGSGCQEEELKKFCLESECDDVRFLGHIDGVVDLFGSAGVVVVPSEWQEAFGLVATEAMACGAACLVSDAGALPEVVGDAGLVFRAGDDADLARKLESLLRDPDERRRLGQAGRRRVEMNFTLDRNVSEQIAVCERVLQAG
jgi:glycosyltransferase involved in cell wall biosynthesis